MTLHNIFEYLARMTDPRRNDRIEHPPRAPFVGFPGGEPRFRAMRLAAALACRRYNDLAEDASPEDREAAYRSIISSGNASSNIPLQSSATPVTTPSVGSHDTSEGARAGTNINTPPSPERDSNNAEPIASLAPTITRSDQPHHQNNYAGYGKCPYIKGPLFIDYGTNVQIDGTTFINRGCVILDTPISRLQIGKKCSIGPGVSFYCVTHPLDPNERHNPDSKNSSEAADIVIGDYVWLGGNVTVLPGVSIGEGCVIGAGSVVTKSMPPYVLAFGNPARIRRRIPRSSDGSVSQTERDRAIKAATTPIVNPLATASTSMAVFSSKPSAEAATIEVGGPIECPKFAIVMQQIQFLKRVVLSLVVSFFVLVVSCALAFMWRRNTPHTFPGAS